MSEQTTEYRPRTVTPPGETLADLLEESGLTQAELAERMGRPTKTINEVIKGKTTITRDTAIQLERVLGASAAFWLAREAHYQEWLARREDLERLKNDSPWLKEIPLTDMVRLQWVEKFSSRPEQVAACLQFFGVASVAAWREKYQAPLVAFRASKAVASSQGAIAAWLRKGELHASQQLTHPYDVQRFKEVLLAVRVLTREEAPERFVAELKAACASCGVVVCFLPTPKGCPVSGATYWLSPVKAVLQLSLRYKTNDHLWFTFFHEAAHIVRHGKKMLFLEHMDGLDQDLEDEADRFARDILIPPLEAEKLSTIPVTKQAVRAFAESIGIAPGIVVGRMQKEKLLPWTHLNSLKVGYSLGAALKP